MYPHTIELARLWHEDRLREAERSRLLARVRAARRAPGRARRQGSTAADFWPAALQRYAGALNA